MAEDLDLSGLAKFLNLELTKVTRMAEKGHIPGRRVSGQWRFSPAEIHHWMEQHIGSSSDDELERLEGALERAHTNVELQDYSISELLLPEAIAIPLEARTKQSVIRSMTDLATGTGLMWDPDRLQEALFQREEMQPTTMEGGIALLHPRRPLSNVLAQPFLAFGRTLQPIPFGGDLGGMTDLFFLILSVDETGHLRTLARLSRLLTQTDFLDELRLSPDAIAVRELIAEREQQLVK